MDDELFVPPESLARKGGIIRFVPTTVLLQCAVCGQPLLLKGKTKDVAKATVVPCRNCIKKAREEAAKPYNPSQVFSQKTKEAIDARIKAILEGKE